MFYGNGNGEDTTHASAGIAFYVKKSLSKMIIGVNRVSSRIIQLTLKLKRVRRLRITQVYAPHAGHMDEVYEAFLEQLAEAPAHKHTQELVISDFNAIVGKAFPVECFCESYKLHIMNGFFKKRMQRRWTWRSPNAQTLNEIDYILVKNRNTVKDVSVLQRFNAGSDHRALRANVK